MITSSPASFLFVGFAFLMASVIVLSIIPLYLENRSVPKTNFILTTARMNNYVLQMSRSLGKRDLFRLALPSTTKDLLTLNQTQSIMNSSIQYALEQQLKNGDSRDKFYIYISQMRSSTIDLNNMSVSLDFLIVYTRECKSCNTRRQSIIFKQLCSKNQLATSIRFSIPSTNLSFTLSGPVIVYTPFIPIENIGIITRLVSSSQLVDLTNPVPTNETVQISDKFLANNYTLIVTTAKNNYFATLNEADTQISANQNGGPVPLAGAVTMYAGLTKLIDRQAQYTDGSNALNITINQIVLQFWYSNSTIQVIVDFLITFSTSCDNNCMKKRNNQLTNQLQNLTNTSIHIQPANLTDGQVKIWNGNLYVLYDYSLTTQVIANFTGTIIRAIPPTLSIIY